MSGDTRHVHLLTGADSTKYQINSLENCLQNVFNRLLKNKCIIHFSSETELIEYICILYIHTCTYIHIYKYITYMHNHIYYIAIHIYSWFTRIAYNQ